MEYNSTAINSLTKGNVMLYEYDSTNKLVHQYTEDGKLDYKYRYDINGNCIECIETEIDAVTNEQVTNHFKNVFNDKGQKIFTYKNDVLDIVNEYDTNGNKILKYVKDQSIYIHTYNEKNQRILTKRIDIDPMCEGNISITHYEYDTNDRLIRKYYDDSPLQMRYYYDVNGACVRSDHTTLSGNIIVTFTEHDAYGNSIRLTRNGRIIREHVYQNCNLIKSITYSPQSIDTE